MVQKISKLLKNKRAAVFMMMLLMIFVMFVFFMALIEVTKAYTVTYEVETELRRLANNVVENNIDDEWRMDGYNYLNTEDAKQDFLDNFEFYTKTTSRPNRYISAQGIIYGNAIADDGTFLYMIDIMDITTTRGDNGSDPGLVCTGTLYLAPSIPGALNENGATAGNFVFEIPLEIISTNFRTDDNGVASGIQTVVSSIVS